MSVNETELPCIACSGCIFFLHRMKSQMHRYMRWYFATLRPAMAQMLQTPCMSDVKDFSWSFFGLIVWCFWLPKLTQSNLEQSNF